MSISEIREKYIKPLSREEKLQLIQDVVEMLKADSDLSRYFEPEQKVGYYGPVNEPKIAAQLAEMIKSD